MKILLIGRGKMGKLIRETAESTGDEVVAALGHDDLARLGSMNRVADVVIDFSRPEALDAVCEYVRRTGTPLVSGTTGYTPEQKQRLEALGSAAPVLWSANYSLGVAVFVRALQAVSDVLKPDFDIEITETHHNQKADAPSGTAKLLLEAMAVSYTHLCSAAGGRWRYSSSAGPGSGRRPGRTPPWRRRRSRSGSPWSAGWTG